jgi:4-hydroxy-tetrahydrodipicolinate reductase
MGGAVQEAGKGRSDVTIASAIDRDDDMAAALGRCDVYVDFTTPAATKQAAEVAARLRKAAAIARSCSADKPVVPIVVAANFSLGVNLVLGLVRQAARVLGPEWDAEVVETHHKAKRDAPSGTALAIARAIAAGHGVDYDTVKRHTRDGDVGPRSRGEIGVSSVRGGDVIGEHVAYFFGAGERVEIAHRATSRTIFAAGALRAAAWVAGKPPGRYDMLDVLGFEP